jgi:hypothetical protein
MSLLPELGLMGALGLNRWRAYGATGRLAGRRGKCDGEGRRVGEMNQDAMT